MKYSLNHIIDSDLARSSRIEVEAPLYLRFVTFLIDYITIYCLSTLTGIFVGYISSEQYLFFNANQFNPFLDYVIFTSTLFVFYSTEYFFNGQSLGKFLTQTRVKHAYEQNISFKTYFLRCLWRLVPLEAISYLPGMDEHWHDKYSDSYVVFD